MRILVTGGAGFIGSNVVDAYMAAGHDVAVVDNLSSGKKENLNPKARFYKVDIRSEELRGIIASEKPDVINHHAAQISVPASVEDPVYDADVNVKGFLNVLEGARASSVKKIIFISSGGAVYGEAAEYPTSELYQPRPLSPYAITKFVSERYLDFYNHQYGLDYTVLRYANIYGPRQVPHGEAGVVAIFMDRLLAGKQCTLYHFKEEPRGMVRDYCFVEDVAAANLLALEKGSREAVNIGTGVQTHTGELFEAIFNTLRKKAPGLPEELGVMKRAAARAGDLKKSCLVIEKAAKVLGWAPRVSLAQGIEKTLAWRTAERTHNVPAR